MRENRQRRKTRNLENGLEIENFPKFFSLFYQQLVNIDKSLTPPFLPYIHVLIMIRNRHFSNSQCSHLYMLLGGQNFSLNLKN